MQGSGGEQDVRHPHSRNKHKNIGFLSNILRHESVGRCVDWGPQGFWGSGENGYLFSGSWGALVIILGELGSKLIILGI